MPNPNERIGDKSDVPQRKPGRIKTAGAILVAAGVLGGGAAALKEQRQNDYDAGARDMAEAVSDQIESRKDDGVVPGPVNEPGEPDAPGAGPEVGSAYMVERATTPEQNAELQMSATALATSVIDLYNQGIGSRNFVHNDDESGRQFVNVINDAKDKSGYYVLAAELPTGSMNPAEVSSVRVYMVQGETDDSKVVDADNDGLFDNRKPLYSMTLDNNSGTGWELGYEVDASIDVDAAVGPQSKRPQVDFAQQVISRAAEGAPVGQ